MTLSQKIIVGASLLASYFYFFISSSGIQTSNDGSHLALALSVKNYQTLEISNYQNLLPIKPDCAIKEGKMYSDRLPGTALLATPFLLYGSIFEGVLVHNFETKLDHEKRIANLLPNFCGAMSMLVLFLVFFEVFGLSFWMSLLGMLIGGLCTLNVLESTHLFSHAPSMLLITYAIYLCLRHQENLQKKQLLALAAAIGFSVSIELQNVLILVPIGLYLVGFGAHTTTYRTLHSKANILMGFGVVAGFGSWLVFYNYLAFGEFMIKSNKYNPYFPEELSFFTSLSGNVFEGLDHLLTSFQNLASNWNWELGQQNDTPGLLATNPVFLLSLYGFYLLYKHQPKEMRLLLLSGVSLVLVAAFHKTTLVRHIFTAHFVLLIPLGLVLKKIDHKAVFWTYKHWIWAAVLLAMSVYSFLKTMYVTNNYWGRDFDYFEFPQLRYSLDFLWFNAPIVLMGVFGLYWKHSITKTRTSQGL